MIETFSHSEINFPWRESGVRTWTYAHINLHAPWFYVDYKIGIDERSASAMYLLFDEKQISQLLTESDVEITNLYAVTPGFINKTMQWKMDLLKSVSVGYKKVRGQNQKVVRLELANEIEYFYPELKLKSKFHKERDIYFSKKDSLNEQEKS